MHHVRHSFFASITALVAVVIVAGLTTIAVRADRDGCVNRVEQTRMTIRTVELALIHFQTDNDQACPPSVNELVAQKYLHRIDNDGYGQPFEYTCPGKHNPEGMDVVSAGKDQQLGTADDIHSWDF